MAGTPIAGPGRGRFRLLLAAAAATALLLVALSAATLIAGDGEERPSRPPSKDQYQDRILDAGLPFGVQEEALDNLLPGHVLTSGDQERATRVLTRFRQTTDRLITALEETPPPTDVKDLHRRTIQGFKRVRGAIAAGAAAAVLGNDRAYLAAPKEIQDGLRSLATLGPKFGSRGYERLALVAE